MTDIDPGLDSNARIINVLIPDKYLTEIGRVVTQWSLMEAMLDSLIWQAGGLRNDLGRVITSQAQVQGKLDLLGALLWQTNAVLAEQFNPVAEYVRNCLVGRRNMVVHGMWTSPILPMSEHPNPIAGVVKFSAKGRLVSQGRTLIPLSELRELGLLIGEVSAWLMAFATLLPKVKVRRGGLGHKTPETQNPQGCATRRMQSLQLPTPHRKEPPAPLKSKRQRGAKKPAA